MKIQIDTQAKTIKLEQTAKLTELFKIVKKFLPNGEWEQYSIESNTVIYNWGYPIIYEPYRVTCSPTVTTSGGIVTTSVTDTVTAHIYNIETN